MFPIRRCAARLTTSVALAGWCVAAQAASVTMVMHGLNGDIDDWVMAMADAIAADGRFPGTNFSCYVIEVVPHGAALATSARRIGGAPPPASDTGEIFVKLDWSQLANNSYSTFQVAAAVTPRLLQTSFIAELGGRALAELPLHLIGHSRGGSLACEISRLLGTNGVWVDHLTTLDPHPLNNDGFNDAPLYTVVDAPARTYENVLFHDNYYQELNLFAYGEPVAGAFVRKLTSLNGGYGGLFGSHSDVHLWYHATIDLRTPTSDTAASVTAAERQSWWTASERAGATAGFHYSLLGRGDRLSTNRPAGAGPIRDGYNQRWNLGAGAANNRTALNANPSGWPNPVALDLLQTNLLAGEDGQVRLRYQFAQPPGEQAQGRLYLDGDYNPFNGNERVITNLRATATGVANIGDDLFLFGTSGVAAGHYAVGIELAHAGRKRYGYASSRLQIMAGPLLTIQRQSNASITIRFGDAPGRTVVLQSSANFAAWDAVATNAGTVSINLPQPASNRFFRGALPPP